MPFQSGDICPPGGADIRGGHASSYGRAAIADHLALMYGRMQRVRELVAIEMCLDVIAHSPQPLRRQTPAGRQREMLDKVPNEADKQGCARAFDQNLVREASFGLVRQSRDEMAQQWVLQRNVELEPGCCRSKRSEASDSRASNSWETSNDRVRCRHG